jgi:hypothetical protein
MSTSSVYAKSDWGKVLGIGWLWLLRPDHVFLCITEDFVLCNGLRLQRASMISPSSEDFVSYQ